MQKSLTTGIITTYIDESWDILKFKLTGVPNFPIGLFDKHYGWKYIQNLSVILTDGSYLYQMWDESKEDFNKNWFDGEIILLSEIDPVFDY
jgi:hypothetical protein